MNHYTKYSVEAFVHDLRFRTWVRNPSREEDLLWEQWLEKNAHMRPIIDEARAIVLSIHPINTESISDVEIENEIQDILGKIEEENTQEDHGRNKRSTFLWLKIAASVSLLAIAGWFTWNNFQSHKNIPLAAENYMIEHVNKSEKPLLINLPDNSSVLLSQNCMIRYPKEFKGDTRNVFLSGEAFFEVTKNPEKPFYVEAGRVVAKVLGTSFEINTALDKQTRIIVRSGSVSVYSKPDHYKKDVKGQQPYMVLTKDDQLIIENDVNRVQHTRLNSASLEALKVPDTQMKFKATPVKDVFTELAKVYGVKIDYTAAQINGCSVTASFTDEPFKLKLDLICRSIGVEYQIVNNWVSIKGAGCKTN